MWSFCRSCCSRSSSVPALHCLVQFAIRPGTGSTFVQKNCHHACCCFQVWSARAGTVRPMSAQCSLEAMGCGFHFCVELTLSNHVWTSPLLYRIFLVLRLLFAWCVYCMCGRSCLLFAGFWCGLVFTTVWIAGLNVLSPCGFA